jgi:hypothetical protein
MLLVLVMLERYQKIEMALMNHGLRRRKGKVFIACGS